MSATASTILTSSVQGRLVTGTEVAITSRQHPHRPGRTVGQQHDVVGQSQQPPEARGRGELSRP